MQENLALVLGLRGKYEEARSAGQAALPPAKAEQNVAYLRELGQARSRERADLRPAAGEPTRKASAACRSRPTSWAAPRASRSRVTDQTACP